MSASSSGPDFANLKLDAAHAITLTDEALKMFHNYLMTRINEVIPELHEMWENGVAGSGDYATEFENNTRYNDGAQELVSLEEQVKIVETEATRRNLQVVANPSDQHPLTETYLNTCETATSSCQAEKGGPAPQEIPEKAPSHDENDKGQKKKVNATERAEALREADRIRKRKNQMTSSEEEEDLGEESDSQISSVRKSTAQKDLQAQEPLKPVTRGNFTRPANYPPFVKKTAAEAKAGKVLTESELRQSIFLPPAVRRSFKNHFDSSGLIRVESRSIVEEKGKDGQYLHPYEIRKSNIRNYDEWVRQQEHPGIFTRKGELRNRNRPSTGPVRTTAGTFRTRTEEEKKEDGQGCELAETPEEILERAHKQYPRGQKLGVAKELARVKEEHSQDIRKFIRQRSTYSRLLAEQNRTIDDLSRRLKEARELHHDIVSYFKSHGPPPARPLPFLSLDEIDELDKAKGRAKRAEQDSTASIFTSSPVPETPPERAPKRSRKKPKSVPLASKTTPSGNQSEPRGDDLMPTSSGKDQDGDSDEAL